MKIDIVGPGAIGLILAYHLSKNNDVNIIVRKGEEDYYKTIKIIDNDKEIKVNIPVSGELRYAELTIIAVKSYDLESVIKTYSPRGNVLFVQNGLKHLSINFEKIRKFYAVTTWAGRKVEKSVVEITGRGYFKIGGETKIDIKQFVDSGINAEWSDNIEEEIYRKASINSVINPITAVFKVNNGKIIDNPYLWNIAKIISSENANLMNEIGYKIDVEKDVYETCKVTSRNTSSMLQDLNNGRRTEVDSINGELIKTGEKYGKYMPANRMMFNAVSFLEKNILKEKEMKK